MKNKPTPSEDQVSARDAEIAADLRAVLHRLVKVLRKHTRNDEMLSLTERSTLSLIYQHGQILPSELAQIEKVSTQSISQVINRLAEIEYISRTQDEQDKRKVLIALTPSGKEYIDRHRQEKQEWLAHMLHEKITATEKETLAAAIAILSKLLDE